MKLYFVAGESSGDLHGSNLLKALLSQQPAVKARGMGGDKLQAAGMDLFVHYRETNYMGFVEVARHLRTILRSIRKVKNDILLYRPDVVILIDFPGFNLRIAEFCKKNGIKVCYYISPQIWAWKTSRVKKIKRDVDRMITILPFEKEFYARHGVEVAYAGHPLLDEINETGPDEAFKKQYVKGNKKLIAVLPGSRKMEISQMLPLMVQLAEKYSDRYEFIVAGAPSIDQSFYQSFLHDKPLTLVHSSTYSLLSNAYAAVVTSGTATLETALFNVPQVVCYKGNAISYHIARRLVHINYISLPNLILDKPAVRELIQHEFSYRNLEEEFLAITEGEKRPQILSDYEQLKVLLGNAGASFRAAEEILRI